MTLGESIVRRSGRPTMGFGLGSEPRAERMRSALYTVLDIVKGLTARLSKREEVVLRLGLEASHLEESVAQGDWTRAEAHVEKFSKLLSRLD